MAQIDKEDASKLIELVKCGTPEVQVGDFTFIENGSRRSPHIAVKYKNELIWRYSTDEVSPEFILKTLDLDNFISDFKEDMFDVNPTCDIDSDWEYVEESQYVQEWKTPLEGNTVSLRYDGSVRNGSFVVYAPIEDSSYWKNSYDLPDNDIPVNGRNFEDIEPALVYIANYLMTYSPYEIDKLIRMEEVATEKFQELPGIGTQKVKEIVEEEHIRTYDELLPQIGILSANYKSKCKNEIKEGLENESLTRIDDHEYVKEVYGKVVASNI